MPVFGDLGTMPLPDVLHWIGGSSKTGMLELDCGLGVRQIEFRKGHIGSCCSDDPDERFGQFLVARGRLNAGQLDEAMERQLEGGQRLGWILVDMGFLRPLDIVHLVSSHIEESLLGLIGWREADFRFYEGATCHPDQVEVNLPVDEVLMRGIQLQDELKRIRNCFPSSGVVLARTEAPLPAAVEEHRLAERLLRAIDGRRTLADLVGVAGSAEHLVLRLLFRLGQAGVVEIAEVRPADPDRPLLLDEPEWQPNGSQRGPSPTRAQSLARAADHAVELEAARRLIARSEWSAALELLAATGRTTVADVETEKLLAQAEHGLTESHAPQGVAAASVPMVVDAPSPEIVLEADERYILGLIDGEFDVQTLVARASLREDDVVETLERLLDKGAIELFDPAADRPSDS